MRGLPAPPLFILLFHISSKTTFSHTFTERVTGSTAFHPLVSFLQRRHFHRVGYRLHPFSSSCFISSKPAYSPRGFPAPPLFILLFHIFKNGIFTERVTGSTPFHPLVSFLKKLHFHGEGYRLHPFSSSCFKPSKAACSPRGLPAPPLFILLFHIFKNGILTEKVNYRLHPFSSSCFISSKPAYSPRGLPAPPLFILLFHIFKNGIFTKGLSAPPLFISLFHIFKDGIFTEGVTGSTPFHPLVSYLQKRRFHREGYRLHPFSSSCFRSSETAFSRRGLPAPPLFILFYRPFPFGFLFHISWKTTFSHIFTEGVTCSTLSPSCFKSSKTAFSPRPLPAPPLFILFFQIFKNRVFTETVTSPTPFHLVSYLQRRLFHREGYQLHPFSSSCFISSKTAFSPRGLPAPPLFILLFHIFKNGIFTERVAGSTPFHPLLSYLQRRHFHQEGYRLHPFSSSCFISSKTTLSPRGLPAPPLFSPLFHIFKNDVFTEKVTSSTPFHLLVSYLQKRHFHGEGYRLHPFSSSCFISSKTAFSTRGLPAPPLFIFLFHIFKNNIVTERVTGPTPFHPLVSYLQERHFHREVRIPAPPLFIL